jgi:hypothetical protein
MDCGGVDEEYVFAPLLSCGGCHQSQNLFEWFAFNEGTVERECKVD